MYAERERNGVLLVQWGREALVHCIEFQNCVILQMCGDLIQTLHQALQRLKQQ